VFARLISRAGGEVGQGSGGPQPRNLGQIHGDVIVLLSTQAIMSFAWPVTDRGRYILAIQTDQAAPLNAPGMSRNVIAHELGHTLGLVHNSNSATLMCGPCRAVFKPDAPAFLPLTAQDRARLLQLASR
jgi:hypothetical protein